MKRKEALDCEQLLGLIPEKYLDDNSLDTLVTRILRLGDQACLNCFGSHFGDLAREEPDLSKAQKHYARAFLIGEAQVDSFGLSVLYERRAERHLGAGMPDNAVQDAEQALQFWPDNRFAQTILMAGQLIRGQYKNVAVQLVENATAEYGDLLGTYFGMDLRRAQTGQSWRNDRELQGRIEKCLRLVAMSDSISAAEARRYSIAPPQFNHIPQATLLAELGLPDSTLAAYNRYMDSLSRANTGYDEGPSAYQRSMQAFYDAKYLLADSLMALAVRQARDSLASRPDDEKVGELGEVLHNQSWIAVFARKPDLAIRAALESLELDPGNTGVLTNLGHGYLFSGQFDKALETYRTYTERENNGVNVLLTDFFDLREAGIWSKDAPKALEAILGRKLTKEEREDYGQ